MFFILNKRNMEAKSIIPHHISMVACGGIFSVNEPAKKQPIGPKPRFTMVYILITLLRILTDEIVWKRVFVAINVATSPRPAGITRTMERAGNGDMANKARLMEYKRLTFTTGFGISSRRIKEATENAPIIAPSPKKPIKNPSSFESPSRISRAKIGNITV